MFPNLLYKISHTIHCTMLDTSRRSPLYNLSRMALASVMALLLGSAFLPQRSMQQFVEADISRFVPYVIYSNVPECL